MLDGGRQRRRQLRRIPFELKELRKLVVVLDSPDGQDAALLAKEGKGGNHIGQQPSAQGLHGDKAHIVSSTMLDQRQIFRGGNVAERELQRIEETRGNRLACDSAAMVRDADESHEALTTGGAQSRIGSPFVIGLRDLLWIVELDDVHVIGAQLREAGFEIPSRTRRIRGRRLGCNDDLGADTTKFYSGDTVLLDYRPVLQVEYYIP